MKKKVKLSILGIFLFLILSVAVYAELLDNGVEVEENSELTYYLNVRYDGIDKNGIVSSDTMVSEVSSDYMYVEDKIPDGLTFIEFISSENGSIGASTKDGNGVCNGYVVDDTNEETTSSTTCDSNGNCYYHGLHYTKSDNTIRFKVKSLTAGCSINVGIKTLTPTLDEGETRRDFYNSATAVENELAVVSNVVHVYIGKENGTLYNVEYKYEGDVPSNAPTLPTEYKYASGTTVGVASSINIGGYEFSGWSSDDVEIIDGKFTMPEENIVIKGSFRKIPKYKVTYVIEGTKPEGYIVPSEKEYYEGKTVYVDSTKPGYIFNGYKFSGWKTDDVTISSDNEFIMGTDDVVLVGDFDSIKYKVEYRFYEANLPENSEQYLPDTKEYSAGDIVKLENVIEPKGYKFLGWYKDDEFEMPEENVVIYGEWARENGVFEPQITKEIINKKNSYQAGDKVSYKITVTNTASYPISQIIVRENNEKAYFIEDKGYEVLTKRMVQIDSLEPNETAVIYSEYVVSEKDKGTIVNEVEILKAVAQDYYNLNTDKEYKATAEFVIKEVKNQEEPKNPETLDNIIKYVIIAIVSLVAIIGVCLLIKKMNKK